MAILIDRQLGPDERLKALLDFSGNVEIDPNVSGKFYYKSGLNMYKQFNIYYNEGSWENAFCIYLKYDKLFFDRIKQHPEYRTVPVKVKSVNAAHFRIIKPKAEHAKREIFKQYRRDYISYVEEMKANKRRQIQAEQSNRKTASVKPPKETTIKVTPIDTVSSVRETIKAEEQPDKPLDRNLFTDSTTFEIKSQVSFNTSRKITQLATRKKKILIEEKERAESATKKKFEAQPMDKLTFGTPENDVDQMGEKFAFTASKVKNAVNKTKPSYTRESIHSIIPRYSDESFQ
ncbi:hypothetical protein HUJ04_004362 [Dendroctonus ponderosae]|uniref:USP8 dimerisation domain-containing protein n=1 Tax=Dendroctonus ponderosae TaxID=77166 RepID=A0AAR5PBM5_DENPD|nr:hypothetical protein HUJ04_004362 [Dendroctonus ponderosae]